MVTRTSTGEHVALTESVASGSQSRINSATAATLAPIVVAGMHRSGTSLAAALLQNAGVDIGPRLLAGNWSNPRGHFEDVDFIELQRSIFVAAGRHPDGWVTSPLPDIPASFVEQARLLLEERQRHQRAWGWKDPRSVPLLGLWSSLAPEAAFAIVYRPPWEVLESLFLRGDHAFVEDPELAIRVWTYYNSVLLDLARARPARCVVANMEMIAAQPVAWSRAVAACASVTLSDPDTGICEPHFLHGKSSVTRASIIRRHYPEAIDLYDRLEALTFAPELVASRSAPAEDPDAERHQAMRDWQRVCAHRRIATA